LNKDPENKINLNQKSNSGKILEKVLSEPLKFQPVAEIEA
jgi:hypothetical protein